MNNRFFLKKPQQITINLLWLVTALFFSSCTEKNDTTPNDNSIRIVSLAPNLTEIVCAVGAGNMLVGRTTACDYPPEIISEIPAVGGFGKPSLELLLQTRPTIVLDVDLEDEGVGHAIDKLGLKRERIKCGRLAEIPDAILAAGHLTGHESEASELASAFKARLVEYTRERDELLRKGEEAPNVFVEIWGEPLITAGGKSFLSELIAAAGGKNIGDEIDREYFTAEHEWVVKSDPDIILSLYMSEKGTAIEQVSKRTGWSAIKAVRNGNIYDGFDNNTLLRPGPRVLAGIDSLKRRFDEWRNNKNDL